MAKYTKCKVCNAEVHLINEKYQLVKCEDCKMIFCENIFSQEEFVQVYDTLYNGEEGVYERHSKVEYEKIINNEKLNIGYNRTKLVKRNILNGKCESVLEIGSGIGLVGTYISRENPAIEYKGIEIDKEAFEKSRKLGLDTINGDFTLMQNLETTYDVIMLWEVIEHLQDLKLFLELAYSKLNENGRIILSTPNYNKIYNYPNREKDELFQDKPPIHLNFFTKENIANIFQLHGFKSCKVEVKKYPYLDFSSLKFYTDMLKAVLGKYNGATLYLEAKK